MKPRIRGVLLLIALALLVGGLAGPVQRAWEARAKTGAAQAIADRVARERAAVAAEFEAGRTQILAGIREKLEAGDTAGALRAAARFATVKDPEIRELFQQVAGAESARQRVDAFRGLIVRDCTEAQAKEQFARLIADDHDPAGRPRSSIVGALHIARLTGAHPRTAAVARLREPHTEDPLPPDADWITRVRASHGSRVLPDYLSGLESPRADELICVWRIEGTRRDERKTVRFALDLWLPPGPDSKTLQANPIAYSERPI